MGRSELLFLCRELLSRCISLPLRVHVHRLSGIGSGSKSLRLLSCRGMQECTAT
jgi:hypothetical protein